MRNPKPRRLLTPPPNAQISLQRPPTTQTRSLASQSSLKPSPQKKRRFLVSIRSRPTSKPLDRLERPDLSEEPVVQETGAAYLEPRDYEAESAQWPSIETGHPDFEALQPSVSQTNTTDSYEWFADAVLTEAIPFFWLAPELYVVTGWDSRSGKRTNHWYHIQMDRDETGEHFPVCYCPSAREKATCVHQRYLMEEGHQNSGIPEGPVEHVILFWRDMVEEGSMNIFSVSIDGLPTTAKNRVVVTYVGADSGFGDWRCSRDGVHRCAHITRCQVYLGDLSTANPQTMSGHDDYSMVMTEQVRAKSLAKSNQCCISYLPLMVSDWARLPSDPVLYDEPPPVDSVPDLIALGQNARCSCGHPFHEGSDMMERPCTVYTLLKPISARIQLQRCPHCNTIRYPSKSIGPDCRELGVFNYNNTLLFSHDLLDEYTSSFTSSETSFGAWIKVVTRRYRRWSRCAASAPPSFVEESVFRRAWFGYVALLDLSNDMVCPQCGPTPETVIWDGITLAYNKKQIVDTIYPPTSKHPHAVVRNQRYPRNQCLIEDPRLRKLLSSITSVPLSLHHMLSHSSDMTIDASTIDNTIQTLREVEEAIQLTGEKCYGLRDLLLSCYGSLQLKEKGGPSVESRRFFSQISTNESCMQIINSPALRALQTFLDRPSYETLPRLSCIPCLYRFATHQWTQDKQFSTELLTGFDWIRKRAQEVLSKSITYDVPPLIDPCDVTDGGWQKSSCKYSMPQIRHRPQYPNMSSDISREPKERGGSCNKFYGEYGENKLTGGIMAAWCTHSICYGFHFIPETEGRNDVFSALVTRWPTAPKFVIYDFACQLAPYCRAREPGYFADTTFLIDDFHAMGHTRCSKAFFLKTYAETRPVLGRINSSAAECGNGGLSKIRKSVRYMGQDRAVLYTAVFLSIWNRLKMLKM